MTFCLRAVVGMALVAGTAVAEASLQDAGVEETCALQVVQTRAKASTDVNREVPIVPNCKGVKFGVVKTFLTDFVSKPYKVGAPAPAPAPHWNVPQKIRDLVENDHVLPEPKGGLLRAVQLFPGTINSFATLAEMAYCHVASQDTQLSRYQCKVCEANGFSLSDILAVPGEILFNKTGSLAWVAKIEPYVPPEGMSTTRHAEMSSGCLIAVRGSTTAQEWMEDFVFGKVNWKGAGPCEGCKAHAGFQNTWGALKSKVANKLASLGCHPGDPSQKLYITGHSLGGAVATVASLMLKQDGYSIGAAITFEAPRVGNPAFQEAYNSQLSNSLLYRVTHHRDIVVHLPPRDFPFEFQHTNPEIFYDTDDLNKVKICHKTEDSSCSYQYYFTNTGDHCGVPYSRDCNICTGCKSAIFPSVQ